MLKLTILNVNNDQVITKDYAKADKNWKRRNANMGKTKETERRKVLLMGDSELRKFNGKKLSRNHHSVDVKTIPGAKIGKMKNVRMEECVNIVIVHTGTCNIR